VSGTSPKWSIPYSGGSDIANTIDDVDEAKVLLLDDLVTPFDAGARISRPRSNTGGQPGIAGRTYRSPDGGVDLDLGTSWATFKPGLFTGLPSVSGHASDGLDEGMEILYQTVGMATAGVAPIGMRYSSSAWQEIAGGARRGLVGAYKASASTVAVGTTIVLDTTEFNIGGWFNTTNGLYVPQVAGHYRISWMVNAINGIADSYFQSALVKNGAATKASAFVWSKSVGVGAGGAAVVAANGTTDAFGICVQQAPTSPTVSGGVTQTYMHCELVAAS
jgi:hypothetical protein